MKKKKWIKRQYDENTFTAVYTFIYFAKVHYAKVEPYESVISFFESSANQQKKCQ
jgi:hypothetical protein